jgi:cell division protein FtsW
MNIFSYFKGDRIIWMIVLLLSLLSLLAVYSSVVTLAYKHYDGDTEHYLFKHGKIILLGFFLMWLVHRVKYTYFSRISQILLVCSIPLLLYTLLKGSNLNEASRWIAIPGTGLTFQTSDFAKLALVMYVARVLSVKQAEFTTFKSVLIHLMLPVFAVCGLILPANFSTAALLLCTCLVMMFIGQVKFKYIAQTLGIAVGAFVLLMLFSAAFPGKIKRADTWASRVKEFVKGEEVKDVNKSFQADQAKIAVATGGAIGKGIGHSTQRNFLPHPYSDFIYAIIIEEYGSVIGGFGILLLYLILLYRGVQVAKRSEKTFGVMLAFGLSFGLVFQAMINMAVAVNLFPVTGQPLPFLSMGGTSILFSSIAVGIILSVSRAGEKEEKPAEKEEENGGAFASA